MTFVESFACQSLAHCLTCRSSEIFRKKVDAPAECPRGMTAESDFEKARAIFGAKGPSCRDKKQTVRSTNG